jgi:HK97 gp10 family phage protein
MEVQIEGLTKCIAKLENAGAQMGNTEMRKALRVGGKVIKEAMVERAPVLDKRTQNSTALEPGALRDGIRVYVPQDEEQPQALIGPNAKTAHVARWIEYGHRQVSGGYSKVMADGKTRGPGKAGADVPAYPFLRPAFEGSIAEAGAAVEASLKKSYKEVLS